MGLLIVFFRVTTVFMLILFLLPIFANERNVSINRRPSGIKESYLKSKGLSPATENGKKSANKTDKNSVKKSSTKSETNTKVLIHTIKKGENLTKIARKYNTTAANILSLNKIKNPNKLYVGTRLKIPSTKSLSSTNTSKPAAKPISCKLKFIWPAKNIARVVSDKKGTANPIGITIFSGKKTSVICSENGIVKKIGYMRGFGNYIVIGHTERFMTVYANIDSVMVKEGEKVKKGAPIATLTSSLHFQINQGGKPLDALTVLPKR